MKIQQIKTPLVVIFRNILAAVSECWVKNLKKKIKITLFHFFPAAFENYKNTSFKPNNLLVSKTFILTTIKNFRKWFEEYS